MVLHVTERRCAWNPEHPIPAGARRDAIYCGQPCRQMAHRFRAGYQARPPVDEPLTFAYADPPYPRLARRYYGDHRDYLGEVDHAALVERLAHDYPDGWALSTSSTSLRYVLGLCPVDVRVASWHRGPRRVRSLGPLAAWEPVIYRGGRPDTSGEPASRTDALAYVARARTGDGQRVIGAKPAAFAWWLFELLGARPGDRLDDLFPGSGGVGRAFDIFTHGPPVASGGRT